MSQKLKLTEQINWNQVYYFSIIAECGSIKAAAERLGVGSPTLSEHLSQLEQDLKVRLFQRLHRRLTLTPEGTKLFHCARQMFETGKRFIDHLTPFQMGGFTYGIGIVPGPSYAIAYKAIADFIRSNIEVSCNIGRYTHRDMETALLEGKIDFGFTDHRSERKDIVQSLVFTSELSFFVAHDITEKPLSVHLRELPLIMCRSERFLHSSIEEMLGDLDMHPRHVILVEFPSLAEELCQKGLGIAIMGRSRFEGRSDLRRLEIEPPLAGLKEVLYVSWVAGAENSEGVSRFRKLFDT